MGDKWITMDGKYRKKHYPKGFFAAMAKDARGGGVGLIICGLIFALMGLGVLWLLIAMTQSGDFNTSEDMGVMIFFGILGLIFLVPGVLIILFGIRRCKSGESDWIKKCVEVSGYPESTIRDFANQALEDGAFKMLLGASRTQGFLTTDYIFFYNLLYPCVIKIDDIVGAYLVQTSYTANVSGKRVKMYSKNINIVSNHNTAISSEAKEDTVKQILGLLTGKNPDIDTEEGRLMSEKEYNEKAEALKGENQ